MRRSMLARLRCRTPPPLPASALVWSFIAKRPDLLLISFQYWTLD
jgi:hypothetical protein